MAPVPAVPPGAGTLAVAEHAGGFGGPASAPVPPGVGTLAVAEHGGTGCTGGHAAGHAGGGGAGHVGGSGGVVGMGPVVEGGPTGVPGTGSGVPGIEGGPGGVAVPGMDGTGVPGIEWAIFKFTVGKFGGNAGKAPGTRSCCKLGTPIGNIIVGSGAGGTGGKGGGGGGAGTGPTPAFGGRVTCNCRGWLPMLAICNIAVAQITFNRLSEIAAGTSTKQMQAH